jgi:anthranilate phosphoribosyltransferase
MGQLQPGAVCGQGVGHMLRDLMKQMREGRNLCEAEVAAAVGALVREDVGVEDKAEFLTALAVKGETAEEIACFAEACRRLALAPELDAKTRGGVLLDVVGTGGDRLNTFNISTAAALVASSAGVVVAKHGNRAATSQAGSADVLEALGVKVFLTPTEAGNWLREYGFAFFFAPAYHPAFKNVAAARRLCADRGQRTVFNYLGPLLNPARPNCQLMGVPRPELCGPLARVLQSLGMRRAMVVSGEVTVAAGAAREGVFLDELSTLGPTTIGEFYQDRAVHVSVMELAGLPLQQAHLGDLVGADKETNAGIVRALLRGEDRGPRRDALRLNAGAALFVADRVRSIAEGWDVVGELIDRGAAAAKLEELVAASK